MQYHNFDIWIDTKLTDSYPLRAAAESLGETRGSLSFGPSLNELKEFQERLAQRAIDKDSLIEFGSRLYNCLFTGDIGAIFERCMGEILGKEDEGARIRLRIEPAEVAALPWEFLYSQRKECFLGDSIQCSLVRYIEIFEPIRALETKPPLKMLVAIPQATELDAENEKANLIHALEGLDDYIEVTFLEGVVTLTRISDALMQKRFHIFHFIGHGDFRQDRALLQVNSEKGEPDYVDDAEFASLFLNHLTMKLVVLNSCKGAQVSSSRPLVGMAPRLVKQGIPAVVAMQYSIYDDAAILFGREFYHALFKGWASGRVEVAMCHARNRLASEFPGERDSGAPVLFMRASEGVLFNLVTGKFLKDVPFSEKELHRQQAVARAHEQNLAFLKDRYRESSDPEAEEAIRTEKEELARLKQRLRFRNASLVTAAVIAILMFFFSWIQLFDLLTLDTRMESYSIWLGDLFAKKAFSDEIIMLPINQKTEEYFHKSFDKSWRHEHADLIDRLSQAHVRVIAFDMSFKEGSPDDSKFIAAIRRARSRGTAIIVGVKGLASGAPELTPELKKAVSGWGILCIGRKLGYAMMAPLGIVKDSDSIPSFGLMTAYQGSNNIVVVDSENQPLMVIKNPKTGQRDSIKFSKDTVRNSQPACTAVKDGDMVAEVMISLSPLVQLRDPLRQYPYEQIVGRTDPHDLQRFKGKIVMVGVAKEGEDKFYTLRGFRREERYGFELHADTINALLQRTTIHPLGQWGQFFIMVCLGMVGAFARYWKPRSPILWRSGILMAALLIYFTASIYMYAEYSTLLNSIYHISAFWLAYWATGKVEKRWFP